MLRICPSLNIHLWSRLRGNFNCDEKDNTILFCLFYTDNIKAELGTTYILELNYELPGLKKISNVAEIKPFIYRTEGTGRWEVHIPFEAPTSKMILLSCHGCCQMVQSMPTGICIRGSKR